MRIIPVANHLDASFVEIRKIERLVVKRHFPNSAISHRDGTRIGTMTALAISKTLIYP